MAEYLTVSQVAARYPSCRAGAQKTNPATVSRWILNGLNTLDGRRVKLRALRAGSRWLIRQEDLDEFFRQLAGEGAEPDGQGREATGRAQAASAALEAMGV